MQNSLYKKYHFDMDDSEDNLSSHELYFNKYTEAEIWQSFKSGSEVALTNIYKHFYKPLFRYGSQFTRERSLIQDAIQDVFSEIIKRRNKLSNTSSIKFYLFKSLKTTILRLIKHEEKYLPKADDGSGLDFGLSISQESRIITSQIEEEKRLKLETTLQQLSKRQREILYYYYFEGLTILEISALMGFSNQKSAQNLLYKAIGNLKNKLLTISTLLYISFRLQNFF